MGNKVASPLPSFDNANKSIPAADMAVLRDRYRQICNDNQVLTGGLFQRMNPPSCNAYTRKYVLPRIFTVMDAKKDGFVDWEEFVCTSAMFRLGSQEDKLRFLFLMYEPVKGGYLTREQIRHVITDALIISQKDDKIEVPLNNTDEWTTNLRDLTEGMVDAILLQYAAQENKVDFQEFGYFVQMDSHVQAYFKYLPTLFEF